MVGVDEVLDLRECPPAYLGEGHSFCFIHNENQFIVNHG
jgi:hypothetical protein